MKPITLKIFKYALFILLISPLIINHNYTRIHAQIVYVSVENGIYSFLDRMSSKQLIMLDDEVKPYSRVYIAKSLIEIYTQKNRLSSIESDELEFYVQEYNYEFNKSIKNIYSSENDKINSRWYLYSFENSLFNLKLSPIAGYGISSTGKYSGHSRWIGASIFLTYNSWMGLYFNIRDKGEFGSNVDRNKNFSPITGAWYKAAPNGIEYSDLRGGINLSWDWGSISLLKENFQWGHGSFGQLILSAKPPSFPHLRFSIKPVDWLRLTYIHGWLNSMVKDSGSFYYTFPGTISQQLVESYFSKYIAANILTFTPIDRLDISLGNAIIYSGDLRPEFLIPLMFYKFLDHNTGRGNVNDGNGVMYFDVSAKCPENFHFYTTLLVDVTEIRNILTSDFKNTWIGYTLGSKSVNAFFENFDLTFEYTRINPWVYEHKDEVTNFKHINYYLGHWLGQNADQLRFQIDYQILLGFKVKTFGELIRKGGLQEIYYAYKGINEKDLPFLYPPVRKENRLGLELSYEYMHDLFIKGTYTYSNISDSDLQRTPVFQLGRKISLSLTLNYGF